MVQFSLVVTMKTAYQEATCAEELCKDCPHSICPMRDPEGYECPARIREKLLEQVIEQALLHLNNHKNDFLFMERAFNLLTEAHKSAKIK